MAEPGVHGEFFMNKVLHAYNSEQEKRPIYIDQHWIRIRIAGQDRDIVEREIQDQDKVRFAEEWAKYEKGLSQASSGTPLEMWPRMTPGLVATLKWLNILNVEDMATLSDAGCQRIGMDGYKYREEAQKYLNSASQSSAAAEVERLQSDNETLKSEVADLKDLVARMMEAQASANTAKPEKAAKKTKAAA